MGGAVLTELSELCKDLFLGDKFLLWLAPCLKSYLLPALDSREMPIYWGPLFQQSDSRREGYSSLSLEHL